MPDSQSEAKNPVRAGILDEETLAEAQRLADLQKLEPTPVEQWSSPRKQGFLVMLPSGNIMRMRRTMNITRAVKEGTIPNPLGNVVRQQIQSGLPMIRIDQLDQESLTQTFDLIDDTVVMACVEPKVQIPPEGENPELWTPTVPGHISIMDLTLTDKLFITQVAQGGTTNIDSFREEQTVIVGSVPNSKPVVAPTKRTGGAKRTGSGSKRKSG